MPAARLRILVLATTVPAKLGDGTPEFVVTLAGGLAQRGHRVTLLAPRVRGSHSTTTMQGVLVRRFAYFPRPWEDLADGAIMPNLRRKPHRWLQVLPLVFAFLMETRRQIRRHAPDVIHAHWIIPAGVIAWLAKKRYGVPYVVTAHGADSYVLQNLGGLKHSIIKAASTTVPVSADIAKVLAGAGRVADPVPMGVNFAAWAAEVGPRRPEKGRLLFIGRLANKKGLDVLLDVMPELPEAQLRIVGGGPLEGDLRKRAGAVGVSKRVKFLGPQSREQVQSELQRCAALVIPSVVGTDGDRDGVPVVLSEAVAARVPLVTSTITGLGEHLRHESTAILVQPGDRAGLADALMQVLADPVSAVDRADRAHDELYATLDLANSVDRYEELLRQATSGASN